MLDIRRGIKYLPIKGIVYGPEGIGKSSLGARMPQPLFIDLEGGTNRLDVSRIEKPPNWDALLAIIREVAATPGICKTLVIDTADWEESLAIQDVCRENSVSSIEKIGYGKGWIFLADKFRELIAALDECIAAGINVIVIAHAKMRKFEEPDQMGSYDRWELKLSKLVAPLLKEWCDILLFCKFNTFVVTADNGTKKAQGGKRMMYASHRPSFDAKNRFNLPDEMDLSYDNIRHIFEMAETMVNAASDTELTPLERLRALMNEAALTDNEIIGLAVGQGYADAATPIDMFPENLVKWFIENWTKIVSVIRSNNA